jgi:F0F1-type ATP synthase assembly protein I
MLICILAGILLGTAERFILNVTVDKVRQAKSHDVSLILYRGTTVRVITVIAGLVSGAFMLNDTMFICLVVSYVLTQLTMIFVGLWNAVIRGRRLRKQQ